MDNKNNEPDNKNVDHIPLCMGLCPTMALDGPMLDGKFI